MPAPASVSAACPAQTRGEVELLQPVSAASCRLQLQVLSTTDAVTTLLPQSTTHLFLCRITLQAHDAGLEMVCSPCEATNSHVSPHVHPAHCCVLSDRKSLFTFRLLQGSLLMDKGLRALCSAERRGLCLTSPWTTTSERGVHTAGMLPAPQQLQGPSVLPLATLPGPAGVSSCRSSP